MNCDIPVLFMTTKTINEPETRYTAIIYFCNSFNAQMNRLCYKNYNVEQRLIIGWWYCSWRQNKHRAWNRGVEYAIHCNTFAHYLRCYETVHASSRSHSNGTHRSSLSSCCFCYKNASRAL